MSINKRRLTHLVPLLAALIAVACTEPVTGPRTVGQRGPGETVLTGPEEDCKPRLDETGNRENEETCNVH